MCASNIYIYICIQFETIYSHLKNKAKLIFLSADVLKDIKSS